MTRMDKTQINNDFQTFHQNHIEKNRLKWLTDGVATSDDIELMKSLSVTDFSVKDDSFYDIEECEDQPFIILSISFLTGENNTFTMSFTDLCDKPHFNAEFDGIDYNVPRFYEAAGFKPPKNTINTLSGYKYDSPFMDWWIKYAETLEKEKSNKAFEQLRTQLLNGSLQDVIKKDNSVSLLFNDGTEKKIILC